MASNGREHGEHYRTASVAIANIDAGGVHKEARPSQEYQKFFPGENTIEE